MRRPETAEADELFDKLCLYCVKWGQRCRSARKKSASSPAPSNVSVFGSGAGTLFDEIRPRVKVPSTGTPARLISIDDPVKVTSELVKPAMFVVSVKSANVPPLARSGWKNQSH